MPRPRHGIEKVKMIIITETRRVQKGRATRRNSTRLNPTQPNSTRHVLPYDSTQLNSTDPLGFQAVLDSRDPVVTQLEQLPVNHRKELN